MGSRAEQKHQRQINVRRWSSASTLDSTDRREFLRLAVIPVTVPVIDSGAWGAAIVHSALPMNTPYITRKKAEEVIGANQRSRTRRKECD